ncbi:DUF3667 domain-containing protein [Pedobacter fastidiosus]|uniref:DUF3667 domain-containing protein n=1 Tax=Pedobacter fastidiosus TaxID=2765361 RepID=A0ABR7KMK0_9SPHI|nr:DUF3667 domain-containing protein [Pedobacter fastidiosus]MBC6109308.1 DUF3667 domain-containing protein [Pedobacter fastidiosus]
MSAGKYRKEHNCLNCGAHVEKHYCSNCGQPNLELKESFWGFISHSIGHYFHFDNKFFQTLTPLLTKPGQVTLDFLAGKRARYINPVSMYIFVSIVYFLVVYSPKHSAKQDHEPIKANKEQSEHVMDSVKKAFKVAGMPNNAIANKTVNSIEKAIQTTDFQKLSFPQQELELQKLNVKNNSLKSDSLAEVINEFEEIHKERNDTTYASYLVRQKKLTPSDQDNWYRRMIKKRAISIGEKSEVIQETLEHNRPKQFFLLMPLLAFFIMLNFRKNHIYYLDHLIFTIHGMTAYFIIEIFTQPIIKHIFGEDSIISSIMNIAVFVFMFWYMFKALTIFYQRKTWSTIFKIFIILLLYAIAFKLTEMVMINLIYYVAT